MTNEDRSVLKSHTWRVDTTVCVCMWVHDFCTCNHACTRTRSHTHMVCICTERRLQFLQGIIHLYCFLLNNNNKNPLQNRHHPTPKEESSNRGTSNYCNLLTTNSKDTKFCQLRLEPRQRTSVKWLTNANIFVLLPALLPTATVNSMFVTVHASWLGITI
ncbi:Hypothetical predicted protein [Podarcis lilfordi]|uniref:Uncharacterized protein n=1 Tax=Podarcis lilfordi TaxID=74358 RepID=A0AA35PT59_9SAUR|nr:Hypothetical predicted protein [Podarcis lilfordi]